MITKASIDTSHGQLYLRKLCRHFARKFPATLVKTQGRIEFDFGPCRIDVASRKMLLSIEVKDDQKVSKAEQILEEQLLRMAKAEQLCIQWQRESLDISTEQFVKEV